MLHPWGGARSVLGGVYSLSLIGKGRQPSPTCTFLRSDWQWVIMSELLPRTHVEFQVKEYWDSFFSKRSKAFEWYGEYTDLCHILHKYLKSSSRVLMVGCGNSKLSEELYDAGFQLIENIDISDVVVRQMSARNKLKRPAMTYTKMDILHMTYEDARFDCVLDKGTLDAIFSNTDDETIQNVEQMFTEIERVLKIAGRYICITLAQDHILKKLLERFESGWLVRVHKVLLGDDESESGMGGALPVFAFVLTKMAKVEGRPPMKVCICLSLEDVYLSAVSDYEAFPFITWTLYKRAFCKGYV